MRVGLTPVDALRRRDRQAWAQLAECAAEPNPFLHPDFVLPAAAALRPRGLRLLHCEDEGGWLACLPVVPVLARRDVIGPGLASWRHEYCFLGTPLLAPGRIRDGVRGLVAGARRGLFLALDWVGEGLRDDGLGREPLLSERFDRAFATLHGPRAASPKRQAAAELRRRRRRFADAVGGELTLVEDAGLADTFLRLEASGWKGRAGTAMAMRPGHGDFFLAVCRAFARRDSLDLVALRGAGRIVAMQCNLRAGEGLFGFKLAYDETLARYSPGRQLAALARERHAGDERTLWIDSCSHPGAELLSGLWPERRSLRTLVVPVRGPLGATVRPGAAAVAAARRGRRRILALRSPATSAAAT